MGVRGEIAARSRRDRLHELAQHRAAARLRGRGEGVGERRRGVGPRGGVLGEAGGDEGAEGLAPLLRLCAAQPVARTRRGRRVSRSSRQLRGKREARARRRGCGRVRLPFGVPRSCGGGWLGMRKRTRTGGETSCSGGLSSASSCEMRPRSERDRARSGRGRREAQGQWRGLGAGVIEFAVGSAGSGQRAGRTMAVMPSDQRSVRAS